MSLFFVSILQKMRKMEDKQKNPQEQYLTGFLLPKMMQNIVEDEATIRP